MVAERSGPEASFFLRAFQPRLAKKQRFYPQCGDCSQARTQRTRVGGGGAAGAAQAQLRPPSPAIRPPGAPGVRRRASPLCLSPAPAARLRPRAPRRSNPPRCGTG